MAKQRSHHETVDIPAHPVLYIMVFTGIFVVLSSLAVWLAFNAVWQPPASSPWSGGGEQPANQPQLQEQPTKDLAAWQQRMERRLNSTGWVDREAGIVHMPIDRAMTLLVERGIPTEKPQSDQQN